MARKIALVVLEVLYAGNVQVQALMVIGMLTVIGECLSLTNLAFFLIAVRNVINNRYCHSRDHALRPPSPQHPRARLSCLCLHDIFLRTVFLSRSCRVHVVRSHRFFLFILSSLSQQLLTKHFFLSAGIILLANFILLITIVYTVGKALKEKLLEVVNAKLRKKRRKVAKKAAKKAVGEEVNYLVLPKICVRNCCCFLCR